MASMTNPGDFYEDDEPVDQVKAAFDQGTKIVTVRPNARFDDNTRYLHVPGLSPAEVASPLGRTEASAVL